MNNQPAQEASVLALDIGTSSVRAALYDIEGREIEGTQARIVRRLCTTLEGGADINADEAVEQVANCLDALIARVANIKIETVAVSCFWHSLVGVDREARALTPVYGWADTRAERFVASLRTRFDERETHARTGCRFHASYWPARFLWLSEEQREVFLAVRNWMTFGEFLTLRLFGETAASVSMASGTGMLDERRCVWDEELLKGLNVAAEQLPAIAASHQSLTGLKKAYALRWPTLQDARWFPAIGDGAANNIGAGCTVRERAALMIGTSGAMRVMWQHEPPAELPFDLWSYRADAQRVVVGGALSDGGGLYSWMKETLALYRNDEDQGEHQAGKDEDKKGLDEKIEASLALLEPDAHGLTLLPFWSGERSPNWSTDARGAILGLSLHTRPVEILRAAMEAVSYRFALIARSLERLAPAASIIASGGALNVSKIWAQMLADTLNRPISLSGVAEASSRGAVLLALEATGKIENIADAAPASVLETFEPDATRHARYRAGLERQQRIYERLVADQETAGIISEATRTEGQADERRCEK